MSIRVASFSGEAEPEAKVNSTSKGLSLRQNFSWTFIGNVIYAATQWGVLVVVAKLGTPEMLGQYSFGLAVGSPVFMLTNLQLRGVQATDARNDFSFVDYKSLRYAATALGILVIIGVGVLSGFDKDTSLVVSFVGVAKAIESLSDVYYGFAQRHERMDLIGRSLMAKGVLSLVTMTVLIYLTSSIVWASVGVACVWLLRYLAYDRRFTSIIHTKAITTNWDWSRSLSLARLSLPLGLVMVLVSLTTNIPRYFIQYVLGERALGFYSAIAYLVVAGTTVVSALGQSARPRLASLFAEGRTGDFLRLLGGLVAAAIGLGCGGILVSLVGGKQLLSIIYTPEYASYYKLFTLFMIAGAIQYSASFLGYGITAARQFKIQLPLAATVMLSALILSYVLIHSYGLVGGVVAVALTSLINLVGSVGITYKLFSK